MELSSVYVLGHRNIFSIHVLFLIVLNQFFKWFYLFTVVS